MNEKYLNKLEFNYIKENLANLSNTFEGKILANALTPSSNSLEVQKMLNETSDALKLINEKGLFPISSIPDNSLHIKRLESNLTLSTIGLLSLANVLRAARELLEYYKESDTLSLDDYFSLLYSNKDVENKIRKAIISEDIIADDAF